MLSSSLAYLKDVQVGAHLGRKCALELTSDFTSSSFATDSPPGCMIHPSSISQLIPHCGTALRKPPEREPPLGLPRGQCFSTPEPPSRRAQTQLRSCSHPVVKWRRLGRSDNTVSGSEPRLHWLRSSSSQHAAKCCVPPVF